jgi:hypothetical protein
MLIIVDVNQFVNDPAVLMLGMLVALISSSVFPIFTCTHT